MLLLALLLTDAAGAALIVLDPEFDQDGLAITRIGSGRDEAQAIGIQEDGKIVVAGLSESGGSSEIAVVRYLPDGSVDPDFVFSGAQLIGAGFGSDGIRALQIDSGGVIVLGGYVTENGSKSAALVRLLSDGRLDYQFGEQGIVLFSDAENETDFYDIEIVSEERIIAAGSTGSAAESAVLFVRFNPDGTIDETFGSSGIQRVSSLDGEVRGITIQPDESLVGGGYGLDDQTDRLLQLIKLTPDGQVDESFGDQGLVQIADAGGEIIVHDVGLLPDGRLIAVGEMATGDDVSSIMVGRFLADGSPDQDLSPTGVLRYDIGDQSGAYAVSVLDNGVVLAVGYRRDDTGKDTVILRLEPSSSEIREVHLPESGDSIAGSDEDIREILRISALQVEEGSFNPALVEPVSDTGQEADLITTTLAGTDEQSLAVAALPDGTVYAAGSSGTEDDTAILVSKYTASGQSEPVGSEKPLSSHFYSIKTLPVTDITRVSALTGGRINDLAFDSDECVLECEELCSEDTEDPDSDSDDPDTVTEDEDSVTEDDDTSSEFENETSTLETNATCLETCKESCNIPTIDKRGVVYSVSPQPEYDPDGEIDPPSDGGDGTGDGDNTVSPSDSAADGNNGGIIDTDNPDNPLGMDSLLNLNNYFVYGGQTDEGDGDGEFTSEIADVNPQTVYYVRAYALLSDGTVMYGNEYRFKTNDSCFIATAAFGSIDDAGVRILRQFRDRYLKTTSWGRFAVSWYYHISPPLADLVSQSLLLRCGVLLLLLPVVLWAGMILHLKVILGSLAAALLMLYVRKRQFWNYA